MHSAAKGGRAGRTHERRRLVLAGASVRRVSLGATRCRRRRRNCSGGLLFNGDHDGTALAATAATSAPVVAATRATAAAATTIIVVVVVVVVVVFKVVFKVGARGHVHPKGAVERPSALGPALALGRGRAARRRGPPHADAEGAHLKNV